jgi:guanylate kinase
MSEHNQKLVIISGPSGAGKSTVVRKLLEVSPVPLKLSVSATTRSRREGEVDGIDYHFMTQDEFEWERINGQFLEWMEVFGCGDFYGTLRREVTEGLAAGKWVLLEIDVDGALSVLEEVPDAVTIFLHPGSMAELEKRLRERGTETPESLARRLKVARQEMKYINEYRHEVINDTVDHAVAEICEILKASGE